MSQLVLDQIQQIIITLVAAGLSGVIGWIGLQLNARLQDQHARTTAGLLVRWAEQALVTYSSGAKLSAVSGAMHDRFPQLPTDRIRQMIEAEVHCMKLDLQPIPTLLEAAPLKDAPPPIDQQQVIQQATQQVLGAFNQALTTIVTAQATPPTTEPSTPTPPTGAPHA